MHATSPSGPSTHLTPGLHVVDRGRDRLQIGFDDRRVVVPVSALTREEMDAVRRGVAPNRTLPAWLEAGVLTAGPLPEDSVGRCVAMEAPGDWQNRLRQRSTTSVIVHGDLGVDPEPLLAAAGFGTQKTGARVDLVLCHGLPDPDLLAQLTRDDVPHLLVTYLNGTINLGPFVQPGMTACGECLELHRSDDDPERPDVLRRYREALQRAVPAPTSAVLVTMALAWAVRDLTSYVDGDDPTTWSATIRLDPGGPPVATSWLRHPECGCAWSLPTLGA